MGNNFSQIKKDSKEEMSSSRGSLSPSSFSPGSPNPLTPPQQRELHDALSTVARLRSDIFEAIADEMDRRNRRQIAPEITAEVVAAINEMNIIPTFTVDDYETFLQTGIAAHLFSYDEIMNVPQPVDPELEAIIASYQGREFILSERSVRTVTRYDGVRRIVNPETRFTVGPPGTGTYADINSNYVFSNEYEQTDADFDAKLTGGVKSVLPSSTYRYLAAGLAGSVRYVREARDNENLVFSEFAEGRSTSLKIVRKLVSQLDELKEYFDERGYEFYYFDFYPKDDPQLLARRNYEAVVPRNALAPTPQTFELGSGGPNANIDRAIWNKLLSPTGSYIERLRVLEVRPTLSKTIVRPFNTRFDRRAEDAAGQIERSDLYNVKQISTGYSGLGWTKKNIVIEIYRILGRLPVYSDIGISVVRKTYADGRIEDVDVSDEPLPGFASVFRKMERAEEAGFHIDVDFLNDEEAYDYLTRAFGYGAETPVIGAAKRVRTMFNSTMKGARAYYYLVYRILFRVYDYWDWDDIRERRYYEEDYLRWIAANVYPDMITTDIDLERFNYDQLIYLLQSYATQSLSMRR